MWRALFHCDNAYRLPAVEAVGPRVPHAQDLADRVPRLRRPAGHARHRGDPVARGRASCRLPAHVVRERNFYRDGDTTHYGQPVDRGRAHQRHLDAAQGRPAASTTAATDVAAFNAALHARQARPGDHAGEVRHLVHGHVLQPGRRAGARLPRRQRAGEPRRHRDGPGAVHQDPADRRRQPGRDARPRAADADAHRQGAEHVGHGGLRRHRSERRGRGRCLRAAARAAAAGGGRRCSACDAVGRALRRRRRVPAAAARVPFAAVCEAAYMQRMPLFAQGYYRTPGIHFDRGDRHAASRSTTSPTAPRCRKSRWTASPATYRLLRTDILQDVGDSISPVVDRGQIEGGFIQGVGWLTIEELLWDDQGRVATRRRLHLQAAVVVGAARRVRGALPRARHAARRRVRQQGGGRAAADAGHLGARGHPRRRRPPSATAAPPSPSPARPRPNASSSRSRRRAPCAQPSGDGGRAPASPVLPHARQPVPRRQRARVPRRRRAAHSRRAHRGERRLRGGARRRSRGARHRLARRLRAARLRRHARALSPAAHPRRPGPDAARLARARRAARRGADGRRGRTPPTPRERFVRALAAHGTTTALVFGSHFARPPPRSSRPPPPPACASSAAWWCRTATCGPSCTRRRDEAYRDSTELIRRFHGHGRLLYAVTPRFALSASEADARDVPDAAGRARRAARADAHQRELGRDCRGADGCFPGRPTTSPSTSASRLTGARTVLAHNVHPTDARAGAAGRRRGRRSRTVRAATPRSAAASFPLQPPRGRRRARARSAPTSAAAPASACSRKACRRT